MAINPTNPRKAGNPAGPESAGNVSNPRSLAGQYSTILPNDLEKMRLKAEARGDVGAMQEIESEQSLRSRMSSFKKGGYIKEADGVAQRGKTKGRMC
jgi:hypothetical protein